MPVPRGFACLLCTAKNHAKARTRIVRCTALAVVCVVVASVGLAAPATEAPPTPHQVALALGALLVDGLELLDLEFSALAPDQASRLLALRVAGARQERTEAPLPEDHGLPVLRAGG